MRLSCAGSFASAFQKLLTQSTPRVRMMSSYTAFTSALASAYSMSVTSDTLPSMRFGYISKVIEWLAGLDPQRSEEHTSELQSPCNLVCRLLLEKKKKQQ